MFPRAEDSRIPDSCASRRPEQCGFSGNSDLYGLGIRLGIYLQLLAMTLAMILFGKKGHEQVTTYNIFILSFMIALFVISFTDGCVFEVELIMLQYIIWSGYATILAWIYLVFGEDGASRKGTAGVASLCVYPILGYGFYFWLGIVRDWSTRFVPTPCGTSFFLFAKIDEHNFKKASTAILVFDGYFAGAVALVIVIGTGVGLGFLIRKLFFTKKRQLDGPPSRASSPPATGSPPRATSPSPTRPNPVPNPIVPQVRRSSTSAPKPRRVDSVNLWKEEPWNFETAFERIYECYPHLLAAAFNFVVLIWTVLAVELPIHWNQISDVYSLRSTGQFIPFITGLANLVLITWKHFNPPDDDEKTTEEQPNESGNSPRQSNHSVPVVVGARGRVPNVRRLSANRQVQATTEPENENQAASTSNNAEGEISEKLTKRNTR